MGNKFCCEQAPRQEFDHTITVIHKQEVPKIPDLNQVVKEHLDNHKPFFYELPTKPTIKAFGNDIYEGKVDQKGRPNGYGKMYHQNGSVFIGEFISGVASGDGHYVMANGTYYNGKMKDNKANDVNGHYWSPKLEYWGQILDNQIHGQGKQKGDNHRFHGTYSKGKKVQGVLFWKEDEQEYQYTGPFNNEENFEGQGELVAKDKGTYTGDFVNGTKHGRGVYKFATGACYDGEYYHNEKEGMGKLINKNGQIAYQGEFKKGMPHGTGKAPNKSGQLQEKCWIQGLDKQLLMD